MMKVQTVIECNTPAEMAALATALAVFTQAMGVQLAQAPANQNQGPGPAPAEGAEASNVTALKQPEKPKRTTTAKKSAAAAANGATEPANDNAKPATLSDVQNAAVAWMKAQGAKKGVDTSKAFPAELRAAASALVEKVVGAPLKNLSEIPADKLGAVVEAFSAAS